MSGPWEKFQEPAQEAPAGPWTKFQTPTEPVNDFQPTPYGFKVKPIDLGNGKQSVQRDDGMVWFGPEQGNTGKPGWFNGQGLRAGATPNDPTSFMDTFANELVTKANADKAKGLMGKIIPEPLGAMGGGLVKGGMAAAQLGAHVLGSNAMDRPVEQYDQFQRQNFGDHPIMEAIGQAAPFLASGGSSAAPEALSAAQKVRAALAAIGKASATGAIAAPALTPETGVTSPTDYWTRKLGEAKLGASVGGGLGAAGQVVGGVASKLARPMAPEAQAIQDLGDRFGVRTLAPDLVPPGGMAKTAVLAESVPGSGMVTQRVAQQAEARDAAQKILDQYGIEGDASTKIQQGLANRLATAKASAKAAYDEVGRLAEGKGEVPLDQTLKAIQKFKAQEASAVVPDQGLVGLLDKMETRIKSSMPGAIDEATGLPLNPDGTVTLYHGTTKTGLEGIKSSGRLTSAGEPDVYLTTAKAGTGYGDGTVVPVKVNPSKLVLDDEFPDGRMDFRISTNRPGGSIPVQVDDTPRVDLSYNGVRGLRSDLGSMISDYYKGTNAATGSKGVQVLQGIKDAIEGDLNAFTAANGPDLASAAKRADSIYKNEVIPFKDKALASAVKSSEPDQIYKTFIQAGKGDRAQKFYNALDSDGQAAVRSQMVQDAFTNATDGAQPFSPAKFAQSLEKVKDASGVFFKGQDKFELDGFTNLMRHIQRAGQVGENPTNGQRLVQTLMAGEGVGAVGGAMLGHPAGLVAPALSVASARALTKLFSSNLGKRLLLAAADTPVGSSAMENLIQEDLPRVLGPASAPKNIMPLQTIPKAAGEQDSTIAQN
jgi:hypothetical protein